MRREGGGKVCGEGGGKKVCREGGGGGVVGRKCLRKYVLL